MRFALIFFMALLISGTAFAESRGILIEFVEHHPDAPTVNVYSDEATEQKRDMPIAEAAAILSKAKNWHSTVAVYIVSESKIETKYLLGLLDGMKDNFYLEVSYVELGSRSECSKQLLEQFKSIPKKAPSL